jgi:hypothetical protein
MIGLMEVSPPTSTDRGGSGACSVFRRLRGSGRMDALELLGHVLAALGELSPPIGFTLAHLAHWAALSAFERLTLAHALQRGQHCFGLVGLEQDRELLDEALFFLLGQWHGHDYGPFASSLQGHSIGHSFFMYNLGRPAKPRRNAMPTEKPDDEPEHKPGEDIKPHNPLPGEVGGPSVGGQPHEEGAQHAPKTEPQPPQHTPPPPRR